MKPIFSIIVPSFNQPKYIEYTFQNLIELKSKAAERQIKIEVLLFDSCSNNETQVIIERYKSLFDVIEIKKDKGQYDAINIGIERCSGDYWTWLNTDDTLDIEGFFKLVDILKNDLTIDYVYGSIDYIDENSNHLRSFEIYEVNKKMLTTKVPGIFQHGSFFKK